MNTKNFEAVLLHRLDETCKVLGNKALEYATQDRLYNFNRAADIKQCSPKEALWGMALKHLISVLDLVEGRLNNTEYMVNEKVGDLINYLILLEAVMAEERSCNTRSDVCPTPQQNDHPMQDSVDQEHCTRHKPELKLV
jgi:hypothetical protein